jgi:hypothetical protein
MGRVGVFLVKGKGPGLNSQSWLFTTNITHGNQ